MTKVNNTPAFLEKLLNNDKSLVWRIWSHPGSTYFQYDRKQQDVIDKYMLKTKECPWAYGVFHSNKKSFQKWIDYTVYQKNGYNSKGIDPKTAIKYLKHFIDLAENDLDLKSYLTADGYLDDEDLKSSLYILTGDIKYIYLIMRKIYLCFKVQKWIKLLKYL